MLATLLFGRQKVCVCCGLAVPRIRAPAITVQSNHVSQSVSVAQRTHTCKCGYKNSIVGRSLQSCSAQNIDKQETVPYSCINLSQHSHATGPRQSPPCCRIRCRALPFGTLSLSSAFFSSTHPTHVCHARRGDSFLADAAVPRSLDRPGTRPLRCRPTHRRRMRAYDWMDARGSVGLL